MNILVLLKLDHRDEFVIRYISNIFSEIPKNIHLLNAVEVNGEVPVKPNGQVLDFCTEFDLSGYLKEADENLNQLNQIDLDGVVSRQALVGNKMKIISNFIESNDIDLVIGGAHTTTVFQDKLIHNFTSRLIENVKVPYLTLKCDRSDSELKRIALVREFRNPKKENLDFVKALVENHNAQLSLVKLYSPSKRMSEEEILKGMSHFEEVNGITANKLIVNATSKEEQLKQIIKDYSIDLLAIGSINEEGNFNFVGERIRSEIVNRIESPILIY